MSFIAAWCECGHTTKWHVDGGPCGFWASQMQDGVIVPRVCEEACQELRIEHVEVVA